MSTTFRKFFSVLFALAPAFAVGATAIHWDFRDGGESADSWLEEWTPVSLAAQQEGAIRVEAPPGNVQGEHRALIMEDVYDSSAATLDDAAGTPRLRYEFKPITAGSLRFRAGTMGTQNQNADITLLSHGRPLIIVKIENNTAGRVVTRSGESTFSDTQSWFNRARDYTITWTADGEVTFRFNPETGEPVVFDNLKFLAPGEPDAVTMQVGFGRATRKGLRIESLSLSSN